MSISTLRAPLRRASGDGHGDYVPLAEYRARTAGAVGLSFARSVSAPRVDERLRAIDGLTSVTLRSAGLRRGMRVLDAGCGSGDLSLLVASIVGPNGSVIGIDESSDAIRSASLRAAAAARTNMLFVQQSARQLQLGETVDALVGRSVLLRASDPCGLLRALVRWTVPGGLILFQELAGEGTWPAQTPVLEALFERLGFEPACSAAERRTALAIARIFRSAGLPQPQWVIGARGEEAAGDVPAFVSAWVRV